MVRAPSRNLDGRWIYVLTNMTSQNEVKPRPYAGAYWHTDLSYEAEPDRRTWGAPTTPKPSPAPWSKRSTRHPPRS